MDKFYWVNFIVIFGILFEFGDLVDNDGEYSCPYAAASNIYNENYPMDNFIQRQLGVTAAKCTSNPYRTIDGSCNNLRHPEFGMAGTRYSRLLPAKYSDRVHAPPRSVSGHPLPNPRAISMTMFGDKIIPDSKFTLANMQFGQFVAHDMSRFIPASDTKTCCSSYPHPQCLPIRIPKVDPIFPSKKCYEFVRSSTERDASGPAEQLSAVTSYLDISTVYGNSPCEYNGIREFRNGRMVVDWRHDDYWLPRSRNASLDCDSSDPNQICYKLGDFRDNFMPGIIVVHTIFLREHNRLANTLAKMNPDWSDEVLYQEARKINIAQYQHIIYSEWLPILVGPESVIRRGRNGEYADQYDAEVNPGAFNEYSTGAMRYSHNQIRGQMEVISGHGSISRVLRLSDVINRPGVIEFQNNFVGLVRGLVTQRQKLTDANIDIEIKNYLNRKNGRYGIDLKAFDIQRSRDHGLASYNDARAYCGLRRATSWEGFLDNISSKHVQLLQSLYESHEDVDLAVGGSLEQHVKGALLGPTFRCILVEQFHRTKAGDRYFYDRNDPVTGFTKAQLNEIRKVTFSKILCRNTKYLERIQPRGFWVANKRNNVQLCSTLPTVNLNLWRKQRSPRDSDSAEEPGVCTRCPHSWYNDTLLT